MLKKRLVCIPLLCLAINGVIAQSALQPASSTELWYILAEAEQAFQDRQYDVAAQRYHDALNIRRPLPEAEAGLARILHVEGLVGTAETQYLVALSNTDAFILAESEYEVRYNLADLYLQSNQRFKYEATLLKITDSESQFQDTSILLRMRTLLLDRGFDRLFTLFRFENYYTLNAHAQLGEHFVLSGNYDAAINHLMFAFTKAAEQLSAVSRIHTINDAALFSDLYRQMSRLPVIQNELRYEYDLHRLLFYLGAAIYGDAPQSATWSAIWEMLVDNAPDLPWGRRAQARLANPQLEPLLVPVR